MGFGLAIGVAIVIILFIYFRPDAVSKATAQARSSRDLSPLIALLESVPENRRATCYDQAVKQLWSAYERPLAAQLVRAMAPKTSADKISQYWIRQVLEVEPELARETFDDSFLSSFYVPEVAAQCGKVG